MPSDEFSNHLNVMIGAGQRTRAILYGLFIIFVSTLLLSLQYSFFDWAAYRKKIINNAYICLAFDRGAQDPVPGRTKGDDKCERYFDYVKLYYGVPLDMKGSDGEPKKAF
jgi:hypothetical protein